MYYVCVYSIGTLPHQFDHNYCVDMDARMLLLKGYTCVIIVMVLHATYVDV